MLLTARRSQTFFRRRPRWRRGTTGPPGRTPHNSLCVGATLLRTLFERVQELDQLSCTGEREHEQCWEEAVGEECPRQDGPAEESPNGDLLPHVPLSSQVVEDGEKIQHAPMNELKIRQYNPLQYEHGNGKMTHPGHIPVPRDDAPGTITVAVWRRIPCRRTNPRYMTGLETGLGSPR